jgi:hypothetical protein
MKKTTAALAMSLGILSIVCVSNKTHAGVDLYAKSRSEGNKKDESKEVLADQNCNKHRMPGFSYMTEKEIDEMVKGIESSLQKEGNGVEGSKQRSANLEAVKVIKETANKFAKSSNYKENILANAMQSNWCISYGR